MLTGRPPFKGETPIETIRQVVDDDPVAPSQLVPRVPRDLETISLKCLHKDPARRYASAEALADDLYRYLHGQVIHARRTPLWERAAKWSRRHKPIAASLAIGMATFVGASIGGFAYQRHLRLEEQARSTWSLDQENTGSRLIDSLPRCDFPRTSHQGSVGPRHFPSKNSRGTEVTRSQGPGR